MRKTAEKNKRKEAQDVYGVHSGRHNVYAYLEGRLSGEEKKRFASHVGNCKHCLETLIIWHYENIMAEIKSKLPDNNAGDTDWGWRGSNAQNIEISDLFNNDNLQTGKIH